MSTNGRLKLPSEPLTPGEVSQLLAGCSQKAPTGLRNRALIAVMYRCGLRCEEVLALKASDLDAVKATVRCPAREGQQAAGCGHR